MRLVDGPEVGLVKVRFIDQVGRTFVAEVWDIYPETWFAWVLRPALFPDGTEAGFDERVGVARYARVARSVPIGPMDLTYVFSSWRS